MFPTLRLALEDHPPPKRTETFFLDVYVVRNLSLVSLTIYIWAAYVMAFRGEVSWHIDGFMFYFWWYYWTDPQHLWLLGVAFVIALLPVLELPKWSGLAALGVSRFTGYPSVPRRRVRKWKRRLFLAVILSCSMCIPVVTSATHSTAFVWFMFVPIAVPPAFCVILCLIQRVFRKPITGPWIHPLTYLKSRRTAYDVRVIDGCLPLDALKARELFSESDTAAGLRAEEPWKAIVAKMSGLYADLEMFFGGVVKAHDIAFTDSSWDAFSRVINLHASAIDAVFTSTMEPIEITSQLHRSIIKDRLKVLELSDPAFLPDGFDPADELLREIEKKARAKVAEDPARDRPFNILLILSHADCRRGNAMPIGKILRSCAVLEDSLNVSFTYVLNGQLSIGNQVLLPEVLDCCHYILTDGNHWLRGADDLGIIILGGRRASFPPSAGAPAERVSAKHFESFPFSIEEHTRRSFAPSFVPLVRLRCRDMVSFAVCMRDLVEKAHEQGARLILKGRVNYTAGPPVVQSIIAAHNRSLADEFARRIMACKLQSRKGFDALEICVDPPQSGIVVLALKSAPGGTHAISDIRRRMTGDQGVQGKLLGSNDPDAGIEECDRLRFCFHYYHGSYHVNKVIAGLLAVLNP